ncbi:hypothetical protein [Oceanihabitans sp. 2_MG-2023]|uniref:hypothetical protein n=1 Tax=Oceanihabitans sp. 2_MG-2023 TaxID=3062661 RepID=UPI0026E1DCF5|nr:hypothetical protein [Oceanihabitans sp. 2_MG-2023]
MQLFNKTGKLIFKIAIVAFLTLFLFEMAYRYHVIDFYSAQTNGLNSQKDLDATNIDLMVFGDSFSATSKEINYVDMLRESRPDSSVLNFSVPGFGIRQVNTFADKKIKRYTPKAILYQVYVGNDLIDVNHLWDLEKFSFSRNLYWEASDHFLSLGYLNQRLAILNVKTETRLSGILKKEFDSSFYDIRTKRFLKSDAYYLDNMLMLKGGFKKRYLSWLKHMQDFLDTVPQDVPVYIVWIPHQAQVGDYYYQSMIKLGAAFQEKAAIQNPEYPFFSEAKRDLSNYKNVTHINPLPFFQSKDTVNNRLYFVNDPHINKSGNTVLHSFLQSQIPFN